MFPVTEMMAYCTSVAQIPDLIYTNNLVLCTTFCV